MIDNLAAIGIDAEEEPFDTETYFTQLADGACQYLPVGLVRRLPDVRQLHVRPVPLRRHRREQPRHVLEPRVRRARRRGQADRRPDEQATLFQDAEKILLNDKVGVIPINWYRGDYVYNPETIANFPQTNFGLILWEHVSMVNGGS